MKNFAELIAAMIFGIWALIHLGRVLCPFDVTIAEFHLPIWMSSVFFIVAGLLSAWLLRGQKET